MPPPPFKRPAAPTTAANSGWVEATTTFTQRYARVAICGETDTGRTTLALTGRGPVAILHDAEKVKGIIEPHVVVGKTVRVHNFNIVYPRDAEACKKLATEAWQKADQLFEDAWRWAGTIIVDTEPGYYALRRYARFGTLTPQGDTRDLYNAINFDWRQRFGARAASQGDGRGTTLVSIHTMSDEYRDTMKQTNQGMKKVSEKTGELKMDGHKSIKFSADVIIQTMRDPVAEKHMVKVIKPWFNGGARGMELDDELMRSMGYTENPVTGSCLTLPAILAFITNTPEGEWLT